MADRELTDLEKAELALERVGIVGVRVFDAIRQKILQTVQVAAPAVFQQFSLAVRDLTGTIGQILAPVLAKATALIRAFADAIINLSDEAKKAIQVTLTLVGAVAAFGSVLPRAVAAFQLLRTAVAAAGIGTGPLIVALGVVAGVIAALATDSAQMTGALQTIADAVVSLGQALMRLLEAALPVVKTVLSLAGTLATALAPVIAIVIEAVALFVEMLTPLVAIVSTLAELFGAVLIPVLEAVMAVIKVIADIFAPVLKAVVEAIKSLVEWFLKVINFFRRLFGMKEVGVPEQERERRSSVGAGGRTATFVSGEEVQRRAILAAVQAGRGRDPAEATRALAQQQASEAQRAERQRAEMIRAVKESKGMAPGKQWEEDRQKRA